MLRIRVVYQDNSDPLPARLKIGKKKKKKLTRHIRKFKNC